MQTGSTPGDQNVLVATAGARIIAFLLDSILLAIYLTGVSTAFISTDTEDEWLWVVFVIIPLFAFGLILELLMGGQTPGKRLMGLKVIRLNGSKPSGGDYLLRWVCGLVDFIFLFGVLATVIIAAGGKGQRLGDIVAGTCVIKVTPQPLPPTRPFLTETYSPVFPQAARLDSYYEELIHRALRAHRKHDNFKPVWLLSEKIRSLLEIETNMTPEQFLATLLTDINHLKTQ